MSPYGKHRVKQKHALSGPFFQISVIASGGAGTMEHFKEALTDGKADAALAASLFHFKELEIREVKKFLANEGIPVRL